VRRWKLLKQNFENLTVRGAFSKNAKIVHKIYIILKKNYRKGRFSQNFQVLRLQAVITSQWLQIAGNSLANWPSTRCLVSILPLKSIHGLSLGFTLRTGNVPTQIFGNFPIKTNSTPQCWCCLETDIRKKSRLNRKLKIRNAADNTDITQWQARDTRHRRMQEVNSLCADSGPLRANSALCHSTQYSLLV